MWHKRVYYNHNSSTKVSIVLIKLGVYTFTVLSDKNKKECKISVEGLPNTYNTHIGAEYSEYNF